MSDILRNPFGASQQRAPAHRSIKSAIWEVLKDYRAGLNVNQIVFRIQQRGLKDFTGKRNAVGQVSGDLVRHPKFFVRDPEQKVWFVRPLAPTRLLEEDLMVTRSKAKRVRTPKAGVETGAQALAEKRPKGRTLVGARVSVWWAGDNTFFYGEIVAFEPETDSYTVIYDDGDADNGIRFRNYEVVWNGLHVQLVRVYETDQDEMEVAANAITTRTMANGAGLNGVEVTKTVVVSPGPVVGPSDVGMGQVDVPSAQVVRQPLEEDGVNGLAGNGGGLVAEEPVAVRDEQGRADVYVERPVHPNKRPARAWRSTGHTSKQVFPPGHRMSQPASKSFQHSHPSLSQSQVSLDDALKCADLIASTLTLYRTQQVELADLYNLMRGNSPSPIMDSTTLGELAQRVEGTAWDSGLLAKPLDSESSGSTRFTRFCILSFVKSARATDGQLHLLLEFGEEKARLLLEVAQQKKLSQVQVSGNQHFPHSV